MANTLKFKRGLLAGLPTAAEGEPLFTTDTKDLYIGTSTGNQRFQKYIASGATTQILRGDGSLYSFPLAISSPSNGQVLKFNGTNWVNDSDAGITGSLTTNYLPKATGATTLGNSLFFDNGTTVGVGATSFAYSPKLAISSIGQNSLAIQTTDVVQGSTGTILYLGTNATTGNTFGVIRALGTGGTAVANLVINPTGGNLLLNTTSDSGQGQVLQVNGTTLVTAGATLTTSTFSHTNVNGGINVVNSSTLASGRDAQLRLVNGSTVFGASDRTYQLINTGRSASDSDFTVFYWNGSTYLERFRIFSTGNFGIGTGTTDTTEKLQVVGTAKITSASGASPDFTVTNTASGSWIRLIGAGTPTNIIDSNGTLLIRNGATYTTKLTLDTTGNFGVGVTPSAWGTGLRAIQFGGNGGLVNNSANSTSITHNNFYNGTNFIYLVSSQQASYLAQTNGSFIFYTAPIGTAGNTVTFTQAMTLDGNANLGINVNSPGQKLHIGAATANVTNYAAIGDSTNQRLLLGYSHSSGVTSNIISAQVLTNSTGDLLLSTRTNNASAIVFYTNSATTAQERLRILSDGNMGLRASAYNASVRYGFGNPARIDDAAFIQYVGVGDFTGHLVFATNASTTNVAATEKVRLTADGNFCIGVTTGSDFLNIAASTTAKAQINLASGTAPTAPANGDIWFDGTDLKMRIGGVTKTFTLV